MQEEKSILDLASRRTEDPEGSLEASPQVPISNTQGQDPSVSKALEDLLSKVEDKGAWASVKLPSLGKYNEGVGENIEIKPFTFEDEKILRSVSNMSDIKNAIATLFQRCTRGIPYPELSLVDKAFLLFKLREISYGTEYPIKAECQNCNSENELIIELDKLGTNYVEENSSTETVVFLPDSEVEASVRVPRTGDESVLENPSKVMDNLWRFVSRIGEYEERIVIQNFITKTTARDVAVIRETIFNTKAGIETRVRFKCDQCGNEQTAELPLNENFFSVN